MEGVRQDRAERGLHSGSVTGALKPLRVGKDSDLPPTCRTPRCGTGPMSDRERVRETETEREGAQAKGMRYINKFTVAHPRERERE